MTSPIAAMCAIYVIPKVIKGCVSCVISPKILVFVVKKIKAKYSTLRALKIENYQ
jgi:hypothetical protein